MKRLIAFLFILCTPIVANAASMCMVPSGGTGSYVNPPHEDGNRGTWTISNKIVGESHCSAIGIITSDNITQFETIGEYCWCRVIRIASPNGYLANHNGAWVFQFSINQKKYCSGRCSSYCAQKFNSRIAAKRTMLASPYVEF